MREVGGEAGGVVGEMLFLLSLLFGEAGGLVGEKAFFVVGGGEGVDVVHFFWRKADGWWWTGWSGGFRARGKIDAAGCIVVAVVVVRWLNRLQYRSQCGWVVKVRKSEQMTRVSKSHATPPVSADVEDAWERLCGGTMFEDPPGVKGDSGPFVRVYLLTDGMYRGTVVRYLEARPEFVILVLAGEREDRR